MRSLLTAVVLLGAISATPLEKRDSQAVLDLLPGSDISSARLAPQTISLCHDVPAQVHQALAAHPADPVAALLHAQPEREAELAEPRLLQILGSESTAWMTEGDKLHLHREGKSFIDLTGREGLLREHSGSVNAEGSAPTLPQFVHQQWVWRHFPDISLERIHKDLKHLTSYFNRYFQSEDGEKAARWLHDEVQSIIANSPFPHYISLEYYTHRFRQPSIIARFEAFARNHSKPLTIIGTHFDASNYLFPLLPAPGADDDASGTVTLLEAFRVLVNRGFIPEKNPVEFHWYAGEETGLLGSLDVAQWNKDSNNLVGSVLDLSRTGFVKRNATQTISVVRTEANPDLTDWVASLAKEYISLPVQVVDLPNEGRGWNEHRGSDYIAWTRYGYPSAFVTGSDPNGDVNPHIHTEKDTLDLDDDTGHFSLEHVKHFTQLAIAFVLEQAGMSLEHTPRKDWPDFPPHST